MDGRLRESFRLGKGRRVIKLARICGLVLRYVVWERVFIESGAGV